MRTDGDGNIRFGSSKGGLYYSMLLFCAILFTIALYLTSTDIVFFLAFGPMSLFLGAVMIMIARHICTLETDGIRFPPGIRMIVQEFIPYANIIRFYERSDTGLVIGVSSRGQMWIEFTNTHGKKDGIGITPENREIFITELTGRTGIPMSVNPRLMTG
ncbi:MAG: hypothetical protein FWD92_02190 [Methanomassiliicoccaceae archaeon]|nr:hypothetical protein [Methanomassiliicoccaceae archaeon]